MFTTSKTKVVSTTILLIRGFNPWLEGRCRGGYLVVAPRLSRISK